MGIRHTTGSITRACRFSSREEEEEKAKMLNTLQDGVCPAAGDPCEFDDLWSASLKSLRGRAVAFTACISVFLLRQVLCDESMLHACVQAHCSAGDTKVVSEFEGEAAWHRGQPRQISEGSP